MKCRNCKHLHKGWCVHKLDSPDPDLDRECKDYMRTTNADRLRGADDEELARYLSAMTYGAIKGVYEKLGIHVDDEYADTFMEQFKPTILEMLQLPAEEDT